MGILRSKRVMSQLIHRFVCGSAWLPASSGARQMLSEGKLLWFSVRCPGVPWHLAIRQSRALNAHTFTSLASSRHLRKNDHQSQQLELFLIPKRDFGRKKLIQRFGHARDKLRLGRIQPLFVATLMFCAFYLMMDWAFLKRRFGIQIFPDYILELTHSKAGVSIMDTGYKARNVHEDEIMVAEEHAGIHAFMKIQAIQKQLSKLAEEDPEFAAILLGEPVKDKSEDYDAKREFITQNAKEIVDLEKISVDPSARSKVPRVAPPVNMLERGMDALGFRTKAEEPVPGPMPIDLQGDESGNGFEVSNETGTGGALANPPTKVGFKARKIITYENRIRSYSTPDKIFRYFATIKVVDESGHHEVMMSPQDFLRSITPGIPQPPDLGLDNFLTIPADQIDSVYLGVDEDSIFHQLGSGGLISFSDYVFLLTVLSTSRRHFEIAFKMFDLNGDGNVDAKEFEVVTNLMKNQSSMGARHRDHSNTGNAYKGINSGLISFFFGPNREGILTVEKFLEFQRQLQNEILRLEFTRKSSGNCTISEKEFADLLIAYAGFPAKKKAKMMKRVKKGFHNGDGIILDDFLNFYQVLYSINDIDTALTFYNIAGAPIQRSTMKHVAHTVAGVELSDHIIDVVFVLFDEDGDGKLSNKEFIQVMKQRAVRGLEKPKDTGIGKFMNAISKCAHDVKPTVLGGML